MIQLTIEDIHKSFGATQALQGVSFDMDQGEIVGVLGPSGCGKSTLLNIIAGLETPDSGSISWHGAPLEEIPSHKRGFGLMFQDYALFPHKDVFDNIAFGLAMLRQGKAEQTRRVNQVMEMVGLSGYASRDVNTLSGGEQQRVALARSLAPSPRLLMLDEPLGSLDRTLREKLLFELRDILRNMNQTAIYVTHDQEEAFALADCIVVMNLGKIAQIGTPQMIYGKPASEFVARFLGFRNILEGEVDQGVLQSAIGQFPLAAENGKRKLLLRPDAVFPDSRGSYGFTAVLRERSFRGSQSQVVVETGGRPLTLEFPSATPLPETGETIELSFDPDEAIQILE